MKVIRRTSSAFRSLVAQGSPARSKHDGQLPPAVEIPCGGGARAARDAAVRDAAWLAGGDASRQERPQQQNNGAHRRPIVELRGRGGALDQRARGGAPSNSATRTRAGEGEGTKRSNAAASASPPLTSGSLATGDTHGVREKVGWAGRRRVGRRCSGIRARANHPSSNANPVATRDRAASSHAAAAAAAAVAAQVIKHWGDSVELPAVTPKQAQEAYLEATDVTRAMTPPVATAVAARDDMLHDRFNYVATNLNPAAQYVVMGKKGAVAPAAIGQGAFLMGGFIVLMGAIASVVYVKTQWGVGSAKQLGDRLREKGAEKRATLERSNTANLVRSVSSRAETSVKENVDLVRRPSQELGSHFQKSFKGARARAPTLDGRLAPLRLRSGVQGARRCPPP